MAGDDFWDEFDDTKPTNGESLPQYGFVFHSEQDENNGVVVVNRLGPAAGGDVRRRDLDLDDLKDVKVPEKLPEDSWPGYKDFVDRLKELIRIAKQANKDKKEALAKVDQLKDDIEDLKKKVEDAEKKATEAAEKAKAAEEKNAPLQADRDKYKAWYEAEAAKVKGLEKDRDAWKQAAHDKDNRIKQLEKRIHDLEKRPPGKDPRMEKALYELAAYRSVAWNYHPLHEQVQEAVRTGTYLPNKEVFTGKP